MPHLADFHFLRPWWLLALLPLSLLPWWLARQQQATSDWAKFCDAALLPYILVNSPHQKRLLTRSLLMLGGLLAALALAGPTTERQPAPAFRNLHALVIVLDLSPAMDAIDFKPSRMERARYKIMDLLSRRKDGQNALLVYGGEAFTVTPLTDDAATITAQLAALSPALLPVPGDRSDLGLALAIQSLRQAGVDQGDILLVTSGGLDDTPPDTAPLTQAGYRLSVLGVGTPEGAPIPLAQGGFYQNRRGDIVVARMNPEALATLARQGGGMYQGLREDEQDIETLLRFF